MKKINLSRHVDITDEKGEPLHLGAGEHVLPSSVVSKIETIAKGDPRTKLVVLETLTPKDAAQVAQVEAAIGKDTK